MEIYFDGLLIDPNYYTQLDQSYLMFTEQDNFKLGTTPCNAITLGIDKRYVDKIPSSIIIKINDVQYGNFKIDNVVENKYDYVFKITDGMVNFNFNYDASEIIANSQKFELDGQQYVTLLEIAEDICSKADIPLKTKDFIGYDKHITWYDNTVTARTYIGYIAELNGGYAVINQNGELEIKQYSNEVKDSIPIELCDTFEIGEKHVISGVLYDNGVQKYDFGTEDNETLWIDSNNVFVTSREDIEKIYNIIKGLEFYSFKVQNCPIGNSRVGECIEFVDGNNSYKTFAQYELRYFGDWLGGYKFAISSEKMASTTEIIGGDIDAKYRRLKTIVDRNTNTIQLLSEEIIEVSNTVSGIGTIELPNCSDTPLYKLTIRNACQLFFSKFTFFSSNTFFKSNNLILECDGEETKFKLPPLALRELNGVYDEMIIENQVAKVIKRIGYNAEDGTLYLLDEPVETDLGEVIINPKKGTNKMRLESFPRAYLEVTYLLDNEYTNTFTNKVESRAEIKLASDEINLNVQRKLEGVVDEEGNVTSASIILAINNDGSGITINADKVDINADDILNLLANNTINMTSKNIKIESENFKVNEEGIVTAKQMNITGGEISLSDSGDNPAPTIQIQGASSNILLSSKELSFEPNDTGAATWQAQYGRDGLTLTEHLHYLEMDANYTAKMTAYNIVLSSDASDITTNIQYGQITTRSVNAEYFNNTSLAEKKKNIVEFKNALEILNDIDIYKYNYIDEDDNDKKHIGLIIGDTFKYSKEITNKDNNGTDLYSLISLCVEAIKEQQEELEFIRKEL